jgi:hypothetical protein
MVFVLSAQRDYIPKSMTALLRIKKGRSNKGCQVSFENPHASMTERGLMALTHLPQLEN